LFETMRNKLFGILVPLSILSISTVKIRKSENL
jgi:hypothetical protein